MIEESIVKALLADRRAERRWRNIRCILWVVILLLFAFLIFKPFGIGNGKPAVGAGEPYVALIRMQGIIMPETTFSAEELIPQLNQAFADSAAKGVVLVINSPGGSPVQASILHDKIVALKRKYKKKVVVVGEDVLASGAYLVATAADKIYTNKDTLTGSIGVILSSFGFNQAIEKLGIQRRVFTAGVNKDRLDPFEPLKPEDAMKLKTVLADVHQNFINDVLEGRKNKLQGDKREIFSGDFWTGQQAFRLGLVDGNDNLWSVLSKEFNTVYYHDYTNKQSIMQLLLNNVNTQLHLSLEQMNARLTAQL